MKFVLDNIGWILAAFVSGGMLLWPFVRRGAGGPWVSTLQATQMMNREDALVIDVRDADAYAKGHILGAKSIPLVELGRRAADLQKHKAKAVIVSCQNGDLDFDPRVWWLPTSKIAFREHSTAAGADEAVDHLLAGVTFGS